MVEERLQVKPRKGLVDTFKDKLIEVGVDYFKKNVEKTKKDILKYVEKTIEMKIKKEIKKYSFITVSFILMGLGSLFVLFGMIAGIVYLLNLPTFFTSIFFGGLLLLIGIIIYLIYS